MFRRQPKSETAAAPSLYEVVRTHMPDADEEAQRIVTAIAGLLAAIAYADSHFAPAEESRMRTELARVQWLDARGVDAIVEALRADIVVHATTLAPRYTRELRELANRELRLEVLEVLLDIAAADGTIGLQEVTALRRTADALGLTQADYNALQARHRNLLSFLD
jgi:uncharacterized tellurite resistance protein B-like protein